MPRAVAMFRSNGGVTAAGNEERKMIRGRGDIPAHSALQQARCEGFDDTITPHVEAEFRIQ